MNAPTRAVYAAIAAAAAGAMAAVLAHGAHPRFVLEFDGLAPAGLVRGFYAPERAPDGYTFAWTGPDAQIRVPGASRAVPWDVRVLVRGARPDPATLPDLDILIDDTLVASVRTTNEFQEVVAASPAGGKGSGLDIRLRLSNTFQPGGGDRRPLGVVIDRVTVQPVGDRAVAPPWGLVSVASLTCAIFGLALALIGVAAAAAMAGIMLFAAGIAVTALGGGGPLLLEGWSIAWTTGGGALATVLAVRVVERARGRSLEAGSRFVVAFTLGVLLLELFTLWHPQMPVGDALFHAHRFAWVLDGRWYFTSVAPGGYQFPYPISLYLTAVPLAGLVDDIHGRMVLLRSLVALADAGAGLLLAFAVMRSGGDRLAGALTVAAYHLVPLNWQVQAVANLTNAFGQSLFVMALALAAPGWRSRPNPMRMGVTFVVVTWGMLAHTSTFAIMTVVLALTSLGLAWSGDRDRRRLAAILGGITAVAFAVAVAAYYAWFGDTYAGQWARITQELRGPAASSDPAGRSVAGRLAFVPHAVATYFGWPATALAVAGAVRLWGVDASTPLRTVLGAWSLGCALFLAIGILTPVDLRYYLAWFPALAVLAATGASWMLRATVVSQIAAALLMTWGAWVGLSERLGALR
jgi:hypothetical protein